MISKSLLTEYGLNFAVAEVTGQKLREWDVVDDPGYRVRNPRKLHELIQNPRDYFPELTQRAPLILVTNPDIFYLCFYTLSIRLWIVPTFSAIFWLNLVISSLTNFTTTTPNNSPIF